MTVRTLGVTTPAETLSFHYCFVAFFAPFRYLFSTWGADAAESIPVANIAFLVNHVLIRGGFSIDGFVFNEDTIWAFYAVLRIVAVTS